MGMSKPEKKLLKSEKLEMRSHKKSIWSLVKQSEESNKKITQRNGGFK